MKTNLLLIAALLGAPFMCIGVYVEFNNPQMSQTWWVGTWGLIYITGWLAGMEAIRRLALTGQDRFGRMVVPVVMASLAIADISNIWQLISPSYKPALFWALDFCWPLSHVLMLAVGIATIRAKKLSGFYAWIPIAMGLWFPLTIALSKTPFVLHFSNSYNAVVWIAMALTLFREERLQRWLVGGLNNRNRLAVNALVKPFIVIALTFLAAACTKPGDGPAPKDTGESPLYPFVYLTSASRDQIGKVVLKWDAEKGNADFYILRAKDTSDLDDPDKAVYTRVGETKEQTTVSHNVRNIILLSGKDNEAQHRRLI